MLFDLLLVAVPMTVLAVIVMNINELTAWAVNKGWL